MTTTGDLCWIVLRVFSNAEFQVSREVERKFRAENLWEENYEVLVLTRRKEVMRQGVRQQAEERLLPGYVLFRTRLSPRATEVIRGIQKVLGFLECESGVKVLTDAEVKRLTQQANKSGTSAASVEFSVGELIRVIDGPFSDYEATVETIDVGRRRARVSVDIFGRATPVELAFDQIEHVGR